MKHLVSARTLLRSVPADKSPGMLRQRSTLTCKAGTPDLLRQFMDVGGRSHDSTSSAPGKGLRHPKHRKLVVPQARSGRLQKRETLLPLTGFEPQTSSNPLPFVAPPALPGLCLKPSKGKGKALPITGHEGPEGEMYSSTLPSTSAPNEGGGWSTPRVGSFTPGKDQVPIV